LTKDLKLYLSQRFNKDTVDYHLQAAIRDNLYLRTLPCMIFISLTVVNTCWTAVTLI